MSNDISKITGTKPESPRLVRGGQARPQSASTAPGEQAAEPLKLSEDANKIIKIESTIKTLPEIDSARVEKIRTAVANGDYHIDPKRVAAKFLELESQL